MSDPASASRRGVLVGACAACAAMVTGCSTHNANNGGNNAPAASTGGPASGGTASSGAGSASANVLTTTAKVPVGGGQILLPQKIVVTQPTAGSFKAFTAVCTHAGCTVGTVAGGTIDCPCHGSKFSIKDGSVVNGPATRPLAAIAIKVEGTSIAEA
jgi:nitrite reductase/ring-hydroxylating ferredoxin subunit